MPAWAGDIVVPSDGELAYTSDRIVVGTVTVVQEKRDSSNRFLGTLAVLEWLKGKPAEDTSTKLTLVLEGMTQRELDEKAPEMIRELIPRPPVIPVGEMYIFFLRQGTLSGVYELTDSHVGFRPLEQRDHVLETLEILSRPKDFLNEPDAGARMSAAFALGRRAGRGDAAFFQQLLRDEDERVALIFLEALDADSLSSSDTSLLERECLEHPNPDIKRLLWVKLSEARKLSRETFLKALQHDDNLVRAEAAVRYHSLGHYLEVISKPPVG